MNEYMHVFNSISLAVTPRLQKTRQRCLLRHLVSFWMYLQQVYKEVKSLEGHAASAIKYLRPSRGFTPEFQVDDDLFP